MEGLCNAACMHSREGRCTHVLPHFVATMEENLIRCKSYVFNHKFVDETQKSGRVRQKTATDERMQRLAKWILNNAHWRIRGNVDAVDVALEIMEEWLKQDASPMAVSDR